jgi:hypothetical protein
MGKARVLDERVMIDGGLDENDDVFTPGLASYELVLPDFSIARFQRSPKAGEWIGIMAFLYGG